MMNNQPDLPVSAKALPLLKVKRELPQSFARMGTQCSPPALPMSCLVCGVEVPNHGKMVQFIFGAN